MSNPPPSAAGSAPAAVPAQERLGTSDWWIYRPPGGGKPYYFNAKTNATSWTHPTGDSIPPEAPASAAVTPPAAAPVSSVATTAPAATTSAAKTESNAEPAASTPVVAAPAATVGPNRSELALAWREYMTPEGRSYYHNTLTKKTVWQRPFEMPPPAGAIVARIHSEDDKARFAAGVKAELARRQELLLASKARRAAEKEAARVAEIEASRARRQAKKEAVAATARTRAEAVLKRRIELMGPSADPATAAKYASPAAAEEAFFELLSDKGITPGLSWSDALFRIVRDPRYGALRTLPQRRAAYSRYLTQAVEMQARRDAAREPEWRAVVAAALGLRPGSAEAESFYPRESDESFSAAVAAAEAQPTLDLPPSSRWSAARGAVLALPAAQGLLRVWGARFARKRMGPGASATARDAADAEDSLRDLFYEATDAVQHARAAEEKRRRRALYGAMEALLYEHTVLGKRPQVQDAEALLAALSTAADASDARPPLVYPGAVWAAVASNPAVAEDPRYGAMPSDEDRLAVFDVVIADLEAAEALVREHVLAQSAAEIAAAEDAFVAALDDASVGAVARYCAVPQGGDLAAAGPAYAPREGEPEWLSALFRARYGSIPPSLYPLTPIAPPAFVFAHSAVASSPVLAQLRAALTVPVPRFTGQRAPLLAGRELDMRLDVAVDRWSGRIKEALRGVRRIFTGLIVEGGVAVAIDGEFEKDFHAKWRNDPRYDAESSTLVPEAVAMSDSAPAEGEPKLTRAQAYLLFCTEKDRAVFAARICALREGEAREDFAKLVRSYISIGYLRDKLQRRERETNRDNRNRPLDPSSPAPAPPAVAEGVSAVATEPLRYVMAPADCLPLAEAVAKLDWVWPQHWDSLRRDFGSQVALSKSVLEEVLGDDVLARGREESYYATLRGLLTVIDEERAKEEGVAPSSPTRAKRSAEDGDEGAEPKRAAQ